MKSPQNFKVIHEDGSVFDMHEIGVWISRFHIYSPNIMRNTRIVGNRIRRKNNIKNPRDILITGQINATSLEEFDDIRHKVYRAFYTDNEFKIIRDLTPNRFIYALQEGDYDINQITDSDGEFTFFLKMLDHYIYSEAKTITVPTNFQTFTIGGHESTVWKSKTVFKSSQNPFVLESDVGKIILNFNFIAGDVLEIDYEKRDVFLNGKDLATAIDIKTEWFELPVGEVQLRASHETELTYNERYY